MVEVPNIYTYMKSKILNGNEFVPTINKLGGYLVYEYMSDHICSEVNIKKKTSIPKN